MVDNKYVIFKKFFVFFYFILNEVYFFKMFKFFYKVDIINFNKINFFKIRVFFVMKVL